MGGTIELKSRFGAGTKMTVVVPLEKAPLDLVDVPAPAVLPGDDLVREEVWILVTGALPLVLSALRLISSRNRR
jgi:hypothetical protein